ERADAERIRDGAEPRAAAQPPPDEENDDADDDVGHAERERGVLRDALVQHVPRREPELRLEDEDDAEREEEQPEDQARKARGVAAADDRVGRGRYSPERLKGFAAATAIAADPTKEGWIQEPDIVFSPGRFRPYIGSEMAVDVHADRIPDRDRLVELLREHGVAAEPHGELDI